MRKTPALFLLFFFGAIIGAFFYLDSTFFFEKKICESQGNFWNQQESLCKTQEDKKSVRKVHENG